MIIPPFGYSVAGHLSYFQFFAIMNKASVLIIQVFLCMYAFISLRKYLGMDLLGHNM